MVVRAAATVTQTSGTCVEMRVGDRLSLGAAVIGLLIAAWDTECSLLLPAGHAWGVGVPTHVLC